MDEQFYEKVNKFIDALTQKNDEVIYAMTHGGCYWFARTLLSRFVSGIDCELMYNPKENHFACRLGDYLFDATGEISRDGFETWANYQMFDPVHSMRIKRDCIYIV